MAADETAYEELLTMDQPKVNRLGRHTVKAENETAQNQAVF